jgi:putative FmdB family regulatory protein
MPLYEYQCLACQQLFSERRPFSLAGAEAECPHCHSQRVRKQIPSPAVIGLGKADDDERLPLSLSGDGCACGGDCSCAH